MVRAGARAARRGEGERGLTEPSVRAILLRGLPGFLREGFVPLGAFYLAWRLSGLGAGIAASTAVSALLYLHERRAGRDGLLVRLSLAFVAVTGAAGLLSQSTTVYLGTPVVANAIWAAAFIGSVPLGRPLAGTFACAWYPFGRKFRASAAFKRVYGVESVVWGLYLGARSAVRLATLLHGGVGAFVLVAFVTGTPSMAVVLLWSIWYALRKLSSDEPEPPPADPVVEAR